MVRAVSATHAVVACCVLFTTNAHAAAMQSEAQWRVEDPPGASWRTIDIDTTQTTWSDVDVSPDGRAIVFDMLGDPYSLPITGGEAGAVLACTEFACSSSADADDGLEISC